MWKLPLYIITHRELTPGYQIAQVGHAIADFAVQEPETFQRWHKDSQYIVSLAATDQRRLEALRSTLSLEGYDTIPFHEPDLNHALTAFALIPHYDLKKRLSSLPLAGR